MHSLHTIIGDTALLIKKKSNVNNVMHHSIGVGNNNIEILTIGSFRQIHQCSPVHVVLNHIVEYKFSTFMLSYSYIMALSQK